MSVWAKSCRSDTNVATSTVPPGWTVPVSVVVTSVCVVPNVGVVPVSVVGVVPNVGVVPVSVSVVGVVPNVAVVGVVETVGTVDDVVVP